MIRNTLSKLSSWFRYSSASIRILEGAGPRGEKMHLWNYRAAVRAYQTWVYAAATINAKAVASIPLRLYIRKRQANALRSAGYLLGEPVVRTRRVDSRRRKSYLFGDQRNVPSAFVMRKLAEFGDDFEEVTDSHAILELLRQVNPYWNGFDFTEYRMLHLQLTGNAYMHPVLDDATGMPLQLWPMASHWTWVVPDREEWIKGYVYGQNRTDLADFAPDEVVHWKRTNPDDYFYGLGWVEAAWPSIVLHREKRTSDIALFENGARPDYAVIVKGGAQGDALERLEKRIESRLRGPKRQGRMMGFTGDVEIHPLQWPPKDLGDQDEVVEEIAAASSVPVTILKANDPNLASAKSAFQWWREFGISPWLRLDEEKLNEKYLPLWGEDIAENAVLAYDSPVPEDEIFALKESKELVATGQRTVNEARRLRGEPEVEGGDVLRFNGVPLDAMGRQETPPNPFQLPPLRPAVSLPEAPPPDTAPPPQEPDKPAETQARGIELNLNGAQIQAATAIVTAVARGDIPRDSGLGQLQVLFGLTLPQAEQLMGSAGKRDVETTPNPKPKDDDVQSTGDGESAGSSQDHRAGKAAGDAAGERGSADDPSGQTVAASGEPRDDGRKDAGGDRRGPEDDSGTDEGPGDDEGGDGGGDAPDGGSGGGGTVDDADAGAEGHAETEKGGLTDGRPGSSVDSRAVHCGSTDSGDDADRVGDTQDKAGDSRRAQTASAAGTDDEGRAARVVKQSDVWSGRAQLCGCKTKQADDTEREGESERQIREFMDAVASVLGDMRDRVASLLGGGKSRKKSPERVQAALDAARREFDTRLANEIRPFIERIMQQGGTVGLQQIGLEGFFDVTNPQVAEFIRNYTIRLAGQVNETTIAELSRTLGQGLDAGETVADLARRVREADSTFGPTRAERIARSESARAYMEGNEKSWEDSGIVAGKRWEVAAAPCRFCQAVGDAFGDRVIPVGGAFYEQGATLSAGDQRMELDYEDVKHPPLHPNCRCGLIPVLIGE